MASLYTEQASPLGGRGADGGMTRGRRTGGVTAAMPPPTGQRRRQSGGGGTVEGQRWQRCILNRRPPWGDGGARTGEGLAGDGRKGVTAAEPPPTGQQGGIAAGAGQRLRDSRGTAMASLYTGQASPLGGRGDADGGRTRKDAGTLEDAGTRTREDGGRGRGDAGGEGVIWIVGGGIVKVFFGKIHIRYHSYVKNNG